VSKSQAISSSKNFLYFPEVGGDGAIDGHHEPGTWDVDEEITLDRVIKVPRERDRFPSECDPSFCRYG